MTAIQHPLVSENFIALLPRAESDLSWKKTAYKIAEWSYWALAGLLVVGLIATSIAFPSIINPDIALAIAPALALVFALKETRDTWTSHVVASPYRHFIKAEARANELRLLAEKQTAHPSLPPLVTRLLYHIEQGEKAQNEANALFSDPLNEVNYYKGYRLEETKALAHKVHAAAMLHLINHPTETRTLGELVPIQFQRFDERVRLSGVPFGGDYLRGIPRSTIRFGSIPQITATLFGT